MNILFVCKYNRFRSKIAEAYFNDINGNKKNNAKSAGLIKGSPLDSIQVRAAGNLGVKLEGTPQGLSTKLLKWQNAIVVVGDDVPVELFKDNEKYGKKLFIWGIPDSKTDEISESEGIIISIKKKVEEFVGREAK